MEELLLGSHVSFKKDTQLMGSVEEALSYGATAFMLYTGAPQNTARSEIDDNITLQANTLLENNNIKKENIIVHAPYIINPANPKNHDFNVSFLKQEIKRVEQLGLTKIVLHPGSHVGLGVEEGIKNIIDVLNETLTPNQQAIICLETMAGKGSEIGKNFEEIKQIIDGINLHDKVMVCLDTCHINDAGYDLNNFDQILEEFDRIIGIDKLGCVHINDSKNERNTHKDRHENIGFGTIGFENLIKVIYHDKLKGIPKILETPYLGDTPDSKEKPYPPYKFEIEMIRNKQFDKNILEKIRSFYK